MKVNGSNYSVPGAKNLQIFGFEDFLLATTWSSDTPTVYQFGYADDAAGTNFISLIDLLPYLGTGSLSVAAGMYIKGFASGQLTVPTGKFPQWKVINNNIHGGITTRIIGIETV